MLPKKIKKQVFFYIKTCNKKAGSKFFIMDYFDKDATIRNK